jgi:hypothetical protein
VFCEYGHYRPGQASPRNTISRRFSPSPVRTIDSELRLVAVLRRAARERGGPLPSIDVANVLLDERRELTSDRATEFKKVLYRPGDLTDRVCRKPLQTKEEHPSARHGSDRGG